MRSCLVFCFVLATAAPAAAQATYVGASLIGDVARFSKFELDDDDPRGGGQVALDGEALGFALRVGRALGERWGVEFEFARSGEIENRGRQYPIPVPLLPELLPGNAPISNLGLETESTLQQTTFAALAWVGHTVSDRVWMAYSGGATFNRAEVEQEFSLSGGRGNARLAIPSIELTEFGVGAVVGAEAVVSLTDSVALSAGARLQSVTIGTRAGWLVRPAVGARVTF